MALYGPFHDEGFNGSAVAVASALDMLDRLDRLNARWKEEGLPQFRIGIGIHTGEAIVGNIGIARRLQYTALGDTVNLASRLQSSTKELHGTLIVSEAIKEEAEPVLGKLVQFIGRGMIVVKGRQQAVRVFEVLRRDPTRAEELPLLEKETADATSGAEG
jgi:adenylate cyclase